MRVCTRSHCGQVVDSEEEPRMSYEMFTDRGPFPRLPCSTLLVRAWIRLVVVSKTWRVP